MKPLYLITPLLWALLSALCLAQAPHSEFPKPTSPPSPTGDPFKKADLPKDDPNVNLTVTYEIYTVDTDAAAKLYLGDLSDQERYSQTQTLVHQGKAKLEALAPVAPPSPRLLHA